MTQQRRNQIAGIVDERGSVRVSELAEQFGVSEVTVRSDLAHLEKAGHLTRDHGGAVASGSGRKVTSLLALERRAHLSAEEKKRIGRAAAQLVSAGDTIIMDAGTTVVEMARHLGGIPSLTVVTNALNVALEVAHASADARIIMVGGAVSRESSSTLGPLAEQTLGELNVRKAFLGTQALDAGGGLTDTSMEIAQVKRAMIRAAREIILLCDSSKWGSSGFIKVAPLTSIHTLVSDPGLPADAQTAIERLGVRLVLG